MYKRQSRFIYLILIFLFNTTHSINFQWINIGNLKIVFNEFKKFYGYFERYQDIKNYIDDAKNLLNLKLRSVIDYPLFYYKTKSFYNKIKNPKTENNEEDKSQQFKMTNDEIIESHLIVINNLINLHSIKSIEKFTLLNRMQILLILLNITKISLRLFVCYKLHQRIMS